MSRTKRIYNTPDSPLSELSKDTGFVWVPLWHPYKQFWKSFNPILREERVSKWRRLQGKIELRRELERELE